MKNSPRRLLFLAIGVMALAMMLAPVSFAGEDDPGPTQVGEVQGNNGSGDQGASTESAPSLAGSQGPAESSPSKASSPNKASSPSKAVAKVRGVSHTRTTKQAVLATTRTQDVAQAKGGIQAGFGGMATESTPLRLIVAFLGGILLILAAAATLTPLRLRSQS